ncbi:dihydroxyacetone kinase subunit DhaK [Salimicrobium halophilum]|uniref:phosphoenolpyruvate--glycerone phosphotransferase n=1 Tax=Salimicrobium halophilum TaxID=86666 RepID=A0A1G8WLP6_9BACI|nr:dihydroxyacetone kinase subunit DhaK [Salimicrobium halophilum]SDJ79047.1 dihydroxyacetone kinase DhaK subunit [Salimicrobium halophilum]
MKKVINQADNVVREMLEGFEEAHADYVRSLEGTTVLLRKDAPVTGKVSLISGGGSGHEPAHAGYVGEGMLDAAVAGEMFTSPTPDQVFEAIKAANGGEGVFLVIKNYTGDVMNFEMARELAEAEGISVEQVVVNDDVAVEDSSFTNGRRGIAGTVFVHKAAGAKAAEGASLEDVKKVAEKVVANTRSMGVALTPCIVPGSGKPSFTLEEDEMEVGIGIHGEPGIERKKITSADDIAEELLQKVLQDSVDFQGSEVAVMVNGLGATPASELYIVNRYVQKRLRDNDIQVTHTYVGEYMTSLEMAGFSITLMKVDEELKQLLDARADTPAFRK